MRKENGVTLLELIVVIAMLSLVVAMAFTLLNFGNRIFHMSTNSVEIQFDVRAVSQEISDRLRYSDYMKLLNQAEIDGMLASNTFDETKQYFYVETDALTGNQSLILRSGGVVRTLVGQFQGTIGATFTRKPGENLLIFSVKSDKEGQSFHLDTQIFLQNMKTEVETTSLGGNTGEGIVFGPLSSRDSVAKDTSALVQPTYVANSSTSQLQLDIQGEEGSTIHWSASNSILVDIPSPTIEDIDNGYLFAQLQRPDYGTVPISIDLTATLIYGVHSLSKNFEIVLEPYPELKLSSLVLEDAAQNAYYSDTLALQVSGGNGSYSYQVSAMPNGLSLNPSTGVISGIPTDPPGAYPLQFTVTDGDQTTAPVSTLLTIVSPIILNHSTLESSYKKNDTVTITISATGGVGTCTLSAKGYPPTMTFDPTSGILSGKPTTVGTYTITIRATDNNGNYEEIQLVLEARN